VTIAALARPEIRDLRTYQVAASPDDTIRLHANEAPVAVGTGMAEGLNRYPALRPAALTGKMANYYGVAADNILVTRGSSEGIDLLIRTFCSAGRDNVLLTPPVFEMYQVYASVQGARTISVPLRADRDFAVDTDALLAACNARTKLIFLCSPNNPVGTVIPRQQILRIVKARAGKSVVIIDEAYIEYGDMDSLAPLVSQYDNLVVLRTLSKALALAGARCGAVIASAGLIQLLDGVLAPYALSSPVIDSAELALSNTQLTEAQDLIRRIIAERERLRVELGACNAVRRIWPSLANFLLVRFRNLHEVRSCLKDAGIAIRTYDNDAALKDCARITIAAIADNNRLIHSIRSLD
jgi:histidinol-phosphate aminotransferase